MKRVQHTPPTWVKFLNELMGCGWFLFQALIVWLMWLAFYEHSDPALSSLRFFFSPIALIFYPVWYLSTNTRYRRIGTIEKATRVANLLLCTFLVGAFLLTRHGGAAACWAVAGLSVLIIEK